MRELELVLEVGEGAQAADDHGGTAGPAEFDEQPFEHLELEYMTKAGLTPMQALVAATGTAARCLKTADQLGTLEAGKWADFSVLGANPLDDIRNTQKLESVWIAGNQVPAK